MKKEYISPLTCAIEIELGALIMGSTKTNVNVTGPVEGGQFGGAGFYGQGEGKGPGDPDNPDPDDEDDGWDDNLEWED